MHSLRCPAARLAPATKAAKREGCEAAVKEVIADLMGQPPSQLAFNFTARRKGPPSRCIAMGCQLNLSKKPHNASSCRNPSRACSFRKCSHNMVAVLGSDADYSSRLLLLAVGSACTALWIFWWRHLRPGAPRLAAALPVVAVNAAAPLLFRRITTARWPHMDGACCSLRRCSWPPSHQWKSRGPARALAACTSMLAVQPTWLWRSWPKRCWW